MRLWLAIFLVSTRLHAACDQDLSFGTSGVRTYADPSGGANAIGTDLLVLSNGRLLVAGSGERPAGDRDAVWWGLDSSGNQVASGGLHAMAGGVDEDFYAAAQASSGGPVYLAGSAVAASGATLTVMARLSFPALTLDTSFGTNGWITRTGGSTTCGLVVDSSGRPCLAEGQDLTRFLSTGAPDSTFGSGGTFNFSSGALAMDMSLDSQGRFLVSGSGPPYSEVWRILPNATLDGNFAPGGVKGVAHGGSTQEGYAALAILNDDIVAAAGLIFTAPSTSKVEMEKFDGIANFKYGNTGFPVSNFFGQEKASGLILEGDGGALVCGQTVSGVLTYPSLWRLTPPWTADTSFGPQGQRALTATAGSMTRMRRNTAADGYITGAMGSSMALWRFSGCPGAVATPTPVLPNGASAEKPVAFPQPAKEKLTIAFTMPEAGQVELQIFDESGRGGSGLVRGFGAGTANWILDVSGYSPGVYLYTLKQDLPSGSRRLGPAKFAVRP